jgi:hypothetical protein
MGNKHQPFSMTKLPQFSSIPGAQYLNNDIDLDSDDSMSESEEIPSDQSEHAILMPPGRTEMLNTLL